MDNIEKRIKLVVMRYGKKFTFKDHFLKIGLIAIVVYFSQIHPYVHFHHSHEEQETSIEFSLHPIDESVDRIPEQHNHNISIQEDNDSHHHHYEYNRLCDWVLARSNMSRNPVTLDAQHISIKTYSDIEINSHYITYIFESFYLPESIPLSGIVNRGPPSLA